MLTGESQRILTMQRFLDLDISRENELQNIVALAADTCQAQAAFLVFVEQDTIKVKFKAGSLADSLPNAETFYQEVFQGQEVVVIPNTKNNPLFANHPWVTGPANIRFYAGAPLITHDGLTIGALFVVGQEPKNLSDRRKGMLNILARQAVNMAEFELSISMLREQLLEAKSSANKLRMFFESTRSNHLLMDSKMEVLAFNRAFYNISKAVMGIKVKAGTHATQYIFPNYREDFEKNFQIALQGTLVQYERYIEYQGYAPSWVRVSYNPVSDDQGTIIGISFNATDITEQKRNEHKVLEQNEALRKIAHIQSHELRKPVASILGLMNVIKIEGTGPDNENLAMMEKAVLELDHTIQDIVGSIEEQENQSSLVHLP
ncbi:GAF domain-containing protein [Mucilaginibacter robiniae]|uniref:histidine kinase n=1 Tax=Mucilaginibacter robiniae TaxID=2728022 RepID=A0A7L5DTS5_9SPHI|nr:GAF domain-containing protein [Mucilaginibacter robiniae]QJD94500.1 GAF domain-containing protein [Mucilaginibacter robiniae]